MPVTQFRSPVTATNRAEVATVLAGTSSRYEALTLVDDQADAILRTIREPSPAMARSGDPQVWATMVEAAIAERSTL